ncbi:MAG TPA: hypothetical protein VFI61_00535 [Patescibacteria group bacterium]|nr:hypothetical protein [Patescibacteria group bacterium]
MKRFAIIVFFSLIPTILIWLPFFLRAKTFWNIPLPQNGLATIVANYDGPLYLVAAKTLYDKGLIGSNFQFPLPSEYYAAHFPMFPILIRLLSVIVNSPYAMLTITLLTSILAIYFFDKLSNNLFLTFVFAILPARWLIVRSIGSPEPLFIGSIIASLYFFREKKYFWAGVWGAVAQFTKSPAILLFIAYSIYLIWQKKFEFKKYLPIFLIPLSLLLVFVMYYFLTGDFFAYFHSGDNIHLMFPPFQIFNYAAPWVGTFWLEEIIFVYLFGILGIFKLFEKKEFEMAIFSAVYFFFILFVSHRDLVRYSLPIMPFLLLGFSDFVNKKEFKIALCAIIIPIYLFSLAFISQNVMPISNWGPFL